jgi:SM-20-related protein
MASVILDDFLDDNWRASIDKHLRGRGWRFGWKSNSKSDAYAFWHKHFAGYIRKKKGGERPEPYPCDEELRSNSATIHALWRHLAATVMQGHTLYRCYANAQAYGSDGTLHTDKNDWTAVYYPHARWEPNWAGETVLFNEERDDIIVSIYPKPNRLVVFPGNMPHLARGVSRTCPVLRVTLSFKTNVDEKSDDPGALQELPDRAGADEGNTPQQAHAL